MSDVSSATTKSGGFLSTTAISEGVGGSAIIVLTILGLAHVEPAFLTEIAVIVAGLAIFAQGSRIAGEYVQLLRLEGKAGTAVGGSFSFSVALLAGVSGVVLGVLALLQVEPRTLIAVAVIGFGSALVISSGAASNVTKWRLEDAGGSEPLRQLINETVSATGIIQSVIGLTAVVLGILSLAGFTSLTLVLIALLVAGLYLLVSSSAFGSLAAFAIH